MSPTEIERKIAFYLDFDNRYEYAYIDNILEELKKWQDDMLGGKL